MTSTPKKTHALIILDGWGYRSSSEFNAIALAQTPVWDRMIRERPNCLVTSSGTDVGLPPGQMGNSEVGHMNLGAGRVVYQVLSRIGMAVEDGSFLRNETLVGAVAKAAASGRNVHLFGLLSPGGVHSHEDQIRSAAALAYRLVTSGTAEFTADSPEAALREAYERDESDEFVKPTRIGEPVAITDGDVVLFMNFRADRARQLTRAFVADDFTGFARPVRPRLASFVTLTQYADDIDAPFAFGPEELRNGLGEYLESLGMTQLRIAETEKYAHVTFFFSGGREEPYRGEDRILVPSPKVATYDLKPEMSAPEMTDRLVEAILSRRYDLIVCNYANGDMVGHTGDLNAAIQAVECIDRSLGRVIEALERTGGEALITADHGNCEQMHDRDTGGPHTAHTSGPVPLVYVGAQKLILRQSGGILADVAPTLLTLMHLPQPAEMSGQSMILAGRDLDQTIRAW